MNRILKALGLVLVAAFALSASAASAHTPAQFTSGSDWTVLHSELLGEQELEEEQVVDRCKSVELHGSLGTEQETITVEPTFGVTTNETSETECVGEGAIEIPTQFHTNGCHFVFTAGGTESGEMHIACPEGKSIEATLFTLGKWRPCYDIPSQTPTAAKVDYTNQTEVIGGKNVWDFKIRSTVEGITFTKTGVCGTGTLNSTRLTAEYTVSGTDTEGNPVDLTWDPTQP